MRFFNEHVLDMVWSTFFSLATCLIVPCGGTPQARRSVDGVSCEACPECMSGLSQMTEPETPGRMPMLAVKL